MALGFGLDVVGYFCMEALGKRFSIQLLQLKYSF